MIHVDRWTVGEKWRKGWMRVFDKRDGGKSFEGHSASTLSLLGESNERGREREGGREGAWQ